jgi:uncharacterized OB-fold protein
MLDHDVGPLVDETSRAFWDGLRRNVFAAGRCAECGEYLFPAREICGTCHSRDVRDAVVTGPAEIYSFTVNHQNWGPGYEEPYAVLVVDYPQERLRLLGLARTEDLDSIRIGAAVRLDCLTLSNGHTVPAFALCGAEPAHDSGSRP